jgi:CBS domain-containing protein
MHAESITSLPVLDNATNVIGNISHVDTRLLTSTASLPLLRSTCIHLISVILSERGIDDGKDPYPVFHVNPFSTLAHTVAKLVATRSHRMWIVDEPSPSSSGPPTPALTPATLVPPPGPLSGPHSGNTLATPIVTPHTPQNSGNSTLTSAAMPSMSGRLTGVVSLTDILNLFARASGLNPHDPNETRRHRRRSSSASFRRSMDSDVSLAGRSTRSESESGGVGGISISRNASMSGRR